MAIRNFPACVFGIHLVNLKEDNIPVVSGNMQLCGYSWGLPGEVKREVVKSDLCPFCAISLEPLEIRPTLGLLYGNA